MLNFEEFQNYVEQLLIENLPNDVTVSLNEVMKNNNLKLHGIIVKQENTNVAPNIYLDEYYNEYIKGAPINKIMDKIMHSVEIGMDSKSQYADIGKKFSFFDEIKDKIIMVAINTEKNNDLLSQVPHRKKEDLSLIFKVMVDKTSGEFATITIHNDHMKAWEGVTADDLYELAMENTKKILPITVQSMNEVMREMFTKHGMPDDIAEIMLQDMPLDQQMFVISNELKINGAASMFYKEPLSDLADKIGTDLYILPSSIHEVIAVSTNMGSPDMLAEMVKDVNGTQVMEEEQLSDNVYKFDAKEKTLSLATDDAPQRKRSKSR